MFQVFPANLGSDPLFQKIQRQHNLFEWLIVSFLGPDFSAPTPASVHPADPTWPGFQVDVNLFDP